MLLLRLRLHELMAVFILDEIGYEHVPIAPSNGEIEKS